MFVALAAAGGPPAEVLLDDLAPRTIVLANKAYDSNAIRDLIERQGAVPNIPSKANHRWKSCFSRTLHKGRNAVERMFCRLKNYRRIANRYDKLAINFLGAIYLVAAVTWWLRKSRRQSRLPRGWRQGVESVCRRRT